jgi:hypothetical protein
MLKQEKISRFFDTLSAKIDHALPPRGANWNNHYKRSRQIEDLNKKAF